MNRPLWLTLGWLWLAGCAHSPQAPQSAATRIGQINIITAPVGLNLDEQPGVDAFSVKVYANDRRNPKTVPITSGSLEIMMFNGTFYGKTNLPAPVKIWKFDSNDLRAYQLRSSIGVAYDFVLKWETNRPSERLITVVARYNQEDGEILVSPASSVTVLDGNHASGRERDDNTASSTSIKSKTE